ncbi:MAG: glycosyltransferase family 2 protein [Hyphomicrobiales bacterium]|nr:glycosyltransferase family 2 protein [Hyphomicrobiales bacterium]
MLATGLTVVVPALNEADRLAATVEQVDEVAGQICGDYEIVIVNDGSTDRTPEIADNLAADRPHARVIHFETSQGVGAGFRAGLNAAAFEKISLVPGDNAFTRAALSNTFAAARKADMVVSYRENMETRTAIRRVLSIICTWMMRIAIGAPLRDAHSLYVWPVACARAVNAPQDYRYHLVTLAGLFRQRLTYVEVPAPLEPSADANSSVMRLSVVTSLGFAVLGLIARRLFAGLSIIGDPSYRHRE